MGPAGVSATTLFSTERLDYARLSAADADGPYLRWLTDPEVTKFLTSRRRNWDAQMLRDYIAAANGNPSVLLVGLFLKSDGRHIGNIRCDPIKWEHGRTIMGFLIGEKALWGRGYASEGVRGICDYAFRALRLRKVYASCNSANTGSLTALAKAGFHREGARAEHFYVDGAWTDQLLFARFCEENRVPAQPVAFPVMERS
jgi:RimJ/RimL family protein N-acetyltransferase